MTDKNTYENHTLDKASTMAEYAKDMFELAMPHLQEFNKLMAYYRCAIMEIETKFNVLNEEFSLQHDRNPINGMTSRLKKFTSIADKLERKNLPMTIENIEENLNDIAGIRVVCAFPDDVYMLANAFLAQDDITLIQKKDYIASPKPNGYRSLHLIVSVPIFFEHEKHEVTVEIQLRTMAMDLWASLEHQLRYKKETAFTEDMERELLDCAHLSAELDRRMNHLRHRVFAEEENKNVE